MSDPTRTKHRIPVILDTDIGGDIDDTWALAMLLKSPELDVKLVVADAGNTPYRARIIAKMLEVADRTDIPVGVGVADERYCHQRQAAWLDGYELADYPGTVHGDGVGAIIDTIMSSPEPVTLVCIGPVPNIGEALRREPRIVENARFVGMHGAVYRGYGSAPPGPECNVANFTPACQAALSAAWDVTITPLDTCGIVVLDGEEYQAVRQCQDPLIQALMANYHAWLAHNERPAHMVQADLATKSSTLFDLVAIYLAFSEDLLVMKDLPIRVTDDGCTVVDATAKRLHVAVDWHDLGAFKKFLVQRLTSGTVPKTAPSA